MRRAVTPISRRRLLKSAGAVGLAPALARCSSLFGGADPFTLGVASGEPVADGFIIWTRLAPEPLSPDPDAPGGLGKRPVAVEWEVAEDEKMLRGTRSGVV